MSARRGLLACTLATGALLLGSPAVHAQVSPWWQGDRDVILGYGCTPIELEPYDPRFDCPAYAAHVHEAMDVDLAYGTPIYAGWPGTVITVGGSGTDRKDYGANYVRIWLDEGHDLLLGHLSAAAVKAGERVEAGTLIGYVGDLGETDIPNLDFSARPHGTTSYDSVDPARFLEFPDVADRSISPLARSGSRLVRARRGRDGAPRLTADGGHTWRRLGPAPAGGLQDDPVLADEGGGRLVALALTAGGGLWWTEMLRPLAPMGSWRSPAVLPAPPVTQLGGRPAVALAPDGTLVIFARAKDGGLWRNERAAYSPLWAGWGRSAGAGTYLGDPAAIRTADGAIQVLAARPGGAFRTRPALVRDRDGVVHAFFVDGGGALYEQAGEAAPQVVACCRQGDPVVVFHDSSVSVTVTGQVWESRNGRWTLPPLGRRPAAL